MSMKAIATGGVHSRNSAGVRGPLSPQELHVLRTVRRELQKQSHSKEHNTSAVLPLLNLPDQATMTIYGSLRAIKAPYVLVLRHPRSRPGKEFGFNTVQRFLDENALFADVSMMFVMDIRSEPSLLFTASDALDEIARWLLTSLIASLRVREPERIKRMAMEVRRWYVQTKDVNDEMTDIDSDSSYSELQMSMVPTQALVERRLDKFLVSMVQERIVAASKAGVPADARHERWTNAGTMYSHVEAMNPSDEFTPIQSYAQLVTLCMFLHVHTEKDSSLGAFGTAILSMLSVSGMMRVQSDAPLLQRRSGETDALLPYQQRYGVVSIEKEELPKHFFSHVFRSPEEPEWLLDSFPVETFFAQSAECERAIRAFDMTHGQQEVADSDEEEDTEAQEAVMPECVLQNVFPRDFVSNS